MDVSLELLNVPAFRKLWDVCDAGAFVHEFSVFIRTLYYGQTVMYQAYTVFPGDCMSVMYGPDRQLENVVIWRCFMADRRKMRYEANDLLLKQVEKILSFWDSCNKHLRYYASRGWKTWWGDMRKYLVVRRSMRAASLMLSGQELWSLAIALYVRKGLGTAEDFACRIKAEK